MLRMLPWATKATKHSLLESGTTVLFQAEVLDQDRSGIDLSVAFTNTRGDGLSQKTLGVTKHRVTSDVLPCGHRKAHRQVQSCNITSANSRHRTLISRNAGSYYGAINYTLLWLS